MKEGTLLKSLDDTVGPDEDHVPKQVENVFKKRRLEEIHSVYKDVNEDI